MDVEETRGGKNLTCDR